MAKDPKDGQTRELLPLWKVKYEMVAPNRQLRPGVIVIDATDKESATARAHAELEKCARPFRIREISEYT